MHLNSKLLFEKFLVPYFHTALSVLEIGPDGFPSTYKKLVNNPNITWHTLDFKDSVYIDNANAKLDYVLTEPYTFPIPDASYEIVVSGQVVEHIPHLWLWMDEVKRILKPGGLLLTINPVSWPYHEAPYDCWRIYPKGIEALAERCGYQILLNTCVSLECEWLASTYNWYYTIPGKSFNYTNDDAFIKKTIRFRKLFSKIPFIGKFLYAPLEVSYDTVSVLQKAHI